MLSNFNNLTEYEKQRICINIVLLHLLKSSINEALQYFLKAIKINPDNYYLNLYFLK